MHPCPSGGTAHHPQKSRHSQRDVLDVEVEVDFRHRSYGGKTTGASRRFRVVCVRDDESDDYHSYVTNLSADEFTAEEIASLYRCRWEVELVFREMKNEYALDEIPTGNPHAVEALLWTGVVTLVVERICYVSVREIVAARGGALSHERFAKNFRERSAAVRLAEMLERRGLAFGELEAIQFDMCGAFEPPREHSVHIKEWRE
ncbi:MAG: transposase [Methanobacteriota archaeon]